MGSVSEKLELEAEVVLAAVFVGLLGSVLHSLPVLARGYGMQVFFGMLSVSIILKAIGGLAVAIGRKDYDWGSAFFVGAASSAMWNFFYITTLTQFSYVYTIPVATQLLFDGFFFGGLSMVIAWYALSRLGLIKKSYSSGELG